MSFWVTHEIGFLPLFPFHKFLLLTDRERREGHTIPEERERVSFVRSFVREEEERGNVNDLISARNVK